MTHPCRHFRQLGRMPPSAQCHPRTGNTLHPHSDVTMDLGSHVLADYAQAVAFNYHDR